TPAFVFTEIVAGDGLTVTVMPKGAGCDNQSRLAMLSPGEGRKGIRRFVVETVAASNGRACPPLVVGVGVGGSFEMAPLLAKKALLQDLEREREGAVGELEDELKAEVNGLGLGAMGLGGTVTALAVPLMTAASHMASLPVAVDLSCHSLRSARATL
ncbi:MAG: fumarate hydratase, partial [Terriglobia bacterium]